MNLLALDTATSVTSVALLEDRRLLCSHSEPSKSHSKTLLPIINTLLHQAGLARRDIQAVAVGIGPGSFTGVRIGLMAAKTLAYAFSIPLVGISSLRALAENARSLHNNTEVEVCPILDALKNEIYCAHYKFSGSQLNVIESEGARAPAEFARKLASRKKSIVLLGNGILRYREIFVDELGDWAVIPEDEKLHEIHASALGLLALDRLASSDTDSPQHLEPLYCRLSEAELARL